MLKNVQAKHRAAKFLAEFVFSFLRVTSVLILFFALLSISFFYLLDLEMQASSVAGPAPEGEYNARRKWGEENLEAYLASAENWIKNNAKIENDVGKVHGVAPIRGPNKHGLSFGESWTTLNLQVIGRQGEGILRIEEFNWGGESGDADWQEKHWAYKRTPALQAQQ